MKFLAIIALCIVGVSALCDDIALTKKAWEDMKHEEVEILYTVFKHYPEIQARFPKFSGKKLETLKGNLEFTVHAAKIIGFMTQVIDLFGDDANLPAIKNLLYQLGKDHKERGVPVKQFEDFNTALVTLFPVYTQWNDKVAASWLCAKTEVLKIMSAGLEGRPLE